MLWVRLYCNLGFSLSGWSLGRALPALFLSLPAVEARAANFGLKKGVLSAFYPLARYHRYNK